MTIPSPTGRIAAAFLGSLLLLPLAVQAQERGSGRGTPASRPNPAAARDVLPAAARPSDVPAKGVQAAKFSTLEQTETEAGRAMEQWLGQQRPPEAPKNPIVAVRAEPLTPANLRILTDLIDNPGAPAEMERQRIEPERLLGIMYTAIVTHHYLGARAELDERFAEAEPGEREAAWKTAQDQLRGVFVGAGMKAFTPADLDEWAAVLTSDPKQRSQVGRLIDTAQPGGRSYASGEVPDPTGTFVPAVQLFRDADRASTSTAKPPALCNQPLAQGTLTRHYGSTWAFSGTITSWCGWTWVQTGNRPWKGHWENKYCTSGYTIASVSWAIDLGVGYSVSCCGASAWGAASATTCGSIVGIQQCASCTASITALTGVSKTTVGSQCSYGLGVVAAVQCKVGSFTVLAATWPFGWAVTGPCKPASFLCP